MSEGMKISVIIEALTGHFDTDIDKTASKAEKRLDKMAKEFDLKFREAALAVVAAGTAMAVFAAEQVEHIAAFKRLGEVMGDTAENVASLQLAADVSGTAMDSISGASVKLTKNLAAVKSETDPVVRAIESLGISFEEFKKLTPVNQLETVARAMDGFQDSSSKTAVALALFGKSGAELLPFLHDLGGEVGRQTVLTNEQIQAAEDLEKGYRKLRSEISLVSEVIGTEMIKALTPASEAIKDVIEKFGGLNAATASLKKNDDIEVWTQNGILALAYLAESLVAIGRTLYALEGSLEVVFADIKLAFTPTTQLFTERGRAELKAQLEERNKTIADANQRYIDLWNYNSTALTDALKKRFAESKGYSNEIQDIVTEAMKPGVVAPLLVPTAAVGTDQEIPFRTGLDHTTKAVIDYHVQTEEEKKAEDEAAAAVKKHAEELEKLRVEIVATGGEQDRFTEAQAKAAKDRANATELFATGDLSSTDYFAFLETQAKGLDDIGERTKVTADAMTEFWKQAAHNMQDSFAQFLFDPFKDGLGGMLQGFADTLRQMAAQAAAAQLFKYLLGDTFGKEGGSLGGVIGDFFGGAKAGGGAVFDDRSYIVGENGPEMFIPRTMGTIMPANSGKSGGISQVFNITTPDADSFRSSQRQIMRRSRHGMGL